MMNVVKLSVIMLNVVAPSMAEGHNISYDDIVLFCLVEPEKIKPFVNKHVENVSIHIQNYFEFPSLNVPMR